MSTNGEYADYESAAAHKLLSDQREAYFEQSAQTRNGEVAPFVMPDLRATAARLWADSEHLA